MPEGSPSVSLILLIAASVCFALEALHFRPVVKWWAAGVAFWLLAQAL